MKRLFEKLVDVKPEEIRALVFGFVFNFIVLSSYYVIRPIRDNIGAENFENLSWMFTATLVVMLVANALFAAIVARMSRRQFIPIAYRFFILNLVAFYFLMRWLPTASQFWVGAAFFVWVSVFNLFVVTLFWAFMVDVFRTDQSKRLFALIAIGGSLGAAMGAQVTASFVAIVGTANLLLVSAAMLELGAWCVKLFPADFNKEVSNPRPSQQSTTSAAEPETAEKPIGGHVWSGLTHALSSPYLLGICAFMLFHSITQTLVYFQQAEITRGAFADSAARTAFFAQIDTVTNIVTVGLQIFVTGRLLKWAGVGITLAMLPLVSLAGFLAIGFMPIVGLLAIFQVLRRAANYAVSRPAREVLFTVLTREDKYKAKSFMDTFVYRAGDQVGAQTYPLLIWFGLGLTGISFLAAPFTAIWLGLSLWLGGKQALLARRVPDQKMSPTA